MKTSELLNILQHSLKVNGDCEVLQWDPIHMMHIPIISAKYITNDDYCNSLSEYCPEYEEDFKQTIGNIILE